MREGETKGTDTEKKTKKVNEKIDEEHSLQELMKQNQKRTFMDWNKSNDRNYHH